MTFTGIVTTSAPVVGQGKTLFPVGRPSPCALTFPGMEEPNTTREDVLPTQGEVEHWQYIFGHAVGEHERLDVFFSAAKEEFGDGLSNNFLKSAKWYV